MADCNTRSDFPTDAGVCKRHLNNAEQDHADNGDFGNTDW